MTERIEFLKKVFSEAGMTLSDLQCRQFIRYRDMLEESNRVMNLTGITEFEQVAIKHFADSCMLFSEKFDAVREKAGICPDASMIDVGTGAGFPGLPLKILMPSLDVLLLDSLQKRVDFLDEVIASIDLTEIDAVHARAEEGARGEYREQFDLAVSRAVAALPVLLEYVLPYVKVGGCFAAYKSGNVEEELAGAENALKLLGGEVIAVEKFTLPEIGDPRSIIFIKKTASTPEKYPRKAGKPSKSPL